MLLGGTFFFGTFGCLVNPESELHEAVQTPSSFLMIFETTATCYRKEVGSEAGLVLYSIPLIVRLISMLLPLSQSMNANQPHP
jgi:hypothetical protein